MHQASDRPSLKWGLRLAALAVLLTTSPLHATPAAASKAYEEARKALEKQDLNAAAIHLKNALQADRQMLAAHLMLGRVLASMGEYKAAEASLEEALKLGVSKAEVAPHLGPVYLQLGEPGKVLALVTADSPIPAVKAQALTLRGSALAMSGNLAQALALFAEARKLDPSLADTYMAEAPVLLRMGEGAKALSAATKATELAPGKGAPWYQLGLVQQHMGDLKAALAAFDKALALEPKHVDSHVTRAMVLIGLGRKAEAEKALAFLKAEKVKEPRASWLRGMLAGSNGDADLAKAEFSDAIGMIDPMVPAVRSNSEALLLAGALSHYHLGNPEKAREYLTTLLGRNGRHVAAQVLLSTILVEAREFGRAATMLENLNRAVPGHAEVMHLLGRVYAARGQLAQATEMLEQAARATPSEATLRDLSVVQLATGRQQQGQANLEKVFAKNPKDLTAGMELAVHYARTGQGGKAVQVAETLVKASPNESALLNFLGNIHGRLGDRKSQRSAYQRALDKSPKFRPVIFNMSWLDLDEGRFDAARSRIQAHLRDSPKDHEALTQLGIIEQRARKPEVALQHFLRADEMQTKDPRPGLAALETMVALRQMEPAVAAAKSLSARFTGNMAVLQAVAQVYVAAGNQALARATMQEASKLAGYNVPQLLEVARLQMRAGVLDGALHSLTKAAQEAPDDVGVLLLGVELAAARKSGPAEVDKAMAALTAKHPNYPGTLLTAGHIALSRGQYAKATASYRALFDKAPTTEVAVLLAQSMLAGNEPDKAIAHLEAWAKRNPADLIAKRALADAQVAGGKPQLAKLTYSELTAADPQNEELVAGYARVLRRLNDPGAVAMAERAFKMAPQKLNLADGYGWMLVETGKLDAGIQILREARLRDPGYPAVRWHLTAALLKAGRKVEAREELQAILAGGLPPPADVDAARVRAELGL